MKNILLIEDNPVHTKLASLLLQRAGHTVMHVINGEHGVALARERQPDLILTDMELPGMCGFDIIRRIKSDPVTAAIPVVVVTSFGGEFPQPSAHHVGADGYVVKPYHYVDFIAAVNQALHGSIQK